MSNRLGERMITREFSAAVRSRVTALAAPAHNRLLVGEVFLVHLVVAKDTEAAFETQTVVGKANPEVPQALCMSCYVRCQSLECAEPSVPGARGGGGEHGQVQARHKVERRV